MEVENANGRIVHKAADGSYYSDKVTLIFTDRENDKHIVYECDPENLYGIVAASMKRLAAGGIDENETGDPAMAALRKRISNLIKTMIKGGLLIWGSDLLTILFGSKEHPKPAKGEDILAWYTDTFTKIGISYLLKKDTILSGTLEGINDTTSVYTVSQIDTRPVTSNDNAAALASIDN